MKLTVGSLFSGIGGFDLGLERAGCEIKWQVEIDPYCRRVLAKHWPGVQRYGDITTVDWSTVQRVDLLCGGFPCQDLSFAGKRAGIDGARSGLWSEYVRAIRHLRPRYVLVENVPGLLTHAYMGRVLGDLSESGYDAEWDCIPASAVGAHHRRDRVWIVAYARCTERRPWHSKRCAVLRQHNQDSEREEGATQFEQCCEAGPEADTTKWAVEKCPLVFTEKLSRQFGGMGRRAIPGNYWETHEPGLVGVAHGIPHRVDRLRGLGNAIVPQIAEALGRMIMEVEAPR